MSERAVVEVKHSNGVEYMLIPMNVTVSLYETWVLMVSDTDPEKSWKVPLDHLEGPYEVSTNVIEMSRYFP